MAPNAYYNYLKDNKAGYCKQKQKLYEKIKRIYYNHNRIIGHHGMKIFLARKGIYLSKTTVHRYMNQELNLHAVTMRKKGTYVRGERNEIFPNLLKQNFTADEKNKIWCTDFTYIGLSNGKMRYNCTMIDLYDSCVVATLNSSYINTELAVNTLKRAINNEKTGAGLILHSDQGCQFTSWKFMDYCKSQEIIQSMSKAGCPYDNAPIERFYKTFKDELVYRYHFINVKALDDAVAQYVFVWYKHVRLHLYDNWMTPFEARNKW
ncbi:Integrase core domain protein [Clostridiales bacterium CHKCI001]|nr:Integrase core domain protein [Clostridiales bacterium CHKCI001]